MVVVLLHSLDGINIAFFACKGWKLQTRSWLLVAPQLPDQPLSVRNSLLASSSRCVYQGKVSCMLSLFTKKISTFGWHVPKGGTLKPLPAAAGKRQSQDASRSISLGWACSHRARVRASLQPSPRSLSEEALMGLQEEMYVVQATSVCQFLVLVTQPKGWYKWQRTNCWGKKKKKSCPYLKIHK